MAMKTGEQFMAQQDLSNVISSKTDIKCAQMNARWEINNIDSCYVTTIHSPVYVLPQISKSEWKIHLSSSVESTISSGFIDITLQYVGASPMPTSYVINMKDVTGKTLCTFSETKNFFYSAHRLQESYGTQFEPQKNILPIIDNILVVELYLRCTISKTSQIVEISDLIAPRSVRQTSVNLSSLLYDETFSDIVLRSSDGKEIPAHRCLLAAGSPVFAAMLSHDMKENQERCIHIDDADSETIKALLQFIYTGKFDPEVHGKEEVFVIADKYGINKLQDLCEYEICKKMSVDNVSSTLLVAIKYDLKSLKEKSCRFIAKFMKNDINSDLKNILVQDPSLFEEILKTT